MDKLKILIVGPQNKLRRILPGLANLGSGTKNAPRKCSLASQRHSRLTNNSDVNLMVADMRCFSSSSQFKTTMIFGCKY
jgi:hypothetical protein